MSSDHNRGVPVNGNAGGTSASVGQGARDNALSRHPPPGFGSAEYRSSVLLSAQGGDQRRLRILSRRRGRKSA